MATGLEAWAARRQLPAGTPVIRCGVGATTLAARERDTVVVCGLAGSLSDALRPGDVIIPRLLALPSGERFLCDAGLQGVFTTAAQELGFRPSTAPLITLPAMATGSARHIWQQRGFAGVDMESALLVPRGGRIAVVRVILDAPGHEIGAEWMSPLLAIRRPRLWPQALRLAWEAPRGAMRAARIVARGLAMLR